MTLVSLLELLLRCCYLVTESQNIYRGQVALAAVRCFTRADCTNTARYRLRTEEGELSPKRCQRTSFL